MSPTRVRRPRPLVLLAVLGLSVAVLAGCSGQKDPTKYSNQVKRSFYASCWTYKVLADDPSIKVSDTASLVDKSAAALKGASKATVTADKDYCKCVRAAVLKKVPFHTFKSVNDKLREDGGPLPASFTKAYASCKDPSAKG